MSPFRICYYSATSLELPSLGQAVLAYRELGLDLNLHARTQTQLFGEAEIKNFVKAAMASHVVYLALHGGRMSCPAFDAVVEAIEKAKPNDGSRPLFIIQSVGGDEEAVLLAKEHGDCFGDARYATINEYFTYGGAENLSSLLRYLHKIRFETDAQIEPARPVPCEGIYHPDIAGACDLETYASQKIDSEKPTVGIWFYQGFWVNQNLAHIDALIRGIEEQGANALAVFSYRLKDAALGNRGADDVVNTFFKRDGRAVVDAVINVMGMSLSVTNPGYRKVLPGLDVPYLQALVSSAPFAVWHEGDQGVSTMDVTYQAAQPEFDGALITVPVATREEDRTCPVTGAMLARNVPIGERTTKLVSLALNWARLSHTPNIEKKLAIVFHHYPPRNDRIGCAAGLDSFASVKHLVDRLEAEGYRIDQQYEDGDALADSLLEKMTCDRRYLTPEKMAARANVQIGPEYYGPWHDDLPGDVKAKMGADWGEPPGDLFVHEEQLLFPGELNGNLFITIQPPRGYLENPQAILHDLRLTPPHHYLAFYRWIKHIFKAHAIVHVGKHGSLEWLPGKALGLSESCYPDLSIMDLPNIYPYIINDPSEGTQAKRRSYCAIVDHLTPVFTNADLYEEMGELERVLAEFKDAERQDPSKVPILKSMLWDAVIKADLHEDLDLDETRFKEDSDAAIGRLHGYLSELSDNMINDGLHTMGLAPDGDRLIELVVQLTRQANGDVPSLRESVAAALGYDYEQAVAHRGETFPGSRGRTGGEVVLEAHNGSRDFIRFLHERNYNPAVVSQAARGLFERRLPDLERVLTYVCETLVPNIRRVTDEMEASLKGFDGRFVPPGPSGAPSRGRADILPTGRNFYSVDPRVIPSRAAYEVGVRLGDALLDRYLDETGEYPSSVGMIVWGGPTMRSKGDDIGEILYLLGLRPIWQPSGVVTGLGVIPLKDLKRPRIDIVPRISGFFRDAFPNLVALIDRAVNMAAILEESFETNFIRKHVVSDTAVYKQTGKTEEEAHALAALRVFGCPPGTYGAGVDELIESKQWEIQDDLAENYVRYSAHAYSAASYGAVQKDAFKTLLGRMDATVKNEDSREYDMLSCTDFYNYYGGLIAAAKSVRGTAPRSFVGDASDPKRVGLRSTAEEAKFVLRSRLLNPKWLEGMKRHGYKGAGDISKVMDIIIGWDATAEVMEDWMYDRVAERYALDPEMQKWLKEVNPHALLNITEKLLETIQRGMWKADQSTEEQLRRAYLEVEGDIEDVLD